MKICLLDVGEKIYGDCLLVTHDDQKLLIDGAHKGDDTLIVSQLSEQLGQQPPFHFDLLVVTHCHADHIGCLPELVQNGELTATWALVADEELGFGHVGEEGARDLVARTPRALTVALQEESYAGLSDAEVAQFLADAATLEDRYRDMLKQLASNGTRVVRFNRDAAAGVREIEAAFSAIRLQVLGPTPRQLELCAEAIGANIRSAADSLSIMASDLMGLETEPDPASLVDIYRSMLRPSATADFSGDAFHRRGMGAKNDQSIVLSLEADGWSALLPGDMQFAIPEVDGLDDLIASLLRLVDQSGPYDFIKTAHHTSNNGLDEDIFDQWSHTALFAHSGGRRDANHPNPASLRVLKSHGKELTFARTDHNGLVTVQKTGGRVTMTKERGRFNDFSPNPKQSGGADQPLERPAARTTVVPAQMTGDEACVEVTARLPHVNTRVILTIEVEPGQEAEATPSADLTAGRGPSMPRPMPRGPIAPARPSTPEGSQAAIRIAPDRSLPKLLFVTHRKRFADNIGQAESDGVFAALQGIGATVVEIPASATTATAAVVPVQAALSKGGYKGVVILGGYDVVPPLQLDVLDAQTRARLEALPPDNRLIDPCIIWSDELYGDNDGDLLPDLPVTRIPDGRRADVVNAALGAAKAFIPVKFGVRNSQRPFAETVFEGVPGRSTALNVSAPFGPQDVTPQMGLGGAYLMLHGADSNGASYWGEDDGLAMQEAWNTSNVPKSAPGTIVFTGCCFAGLTAGPAADQATPSTAFRPRGPEASIAIAYLRAGALAFVGCTGSHYSPAVEPYTYYGQPMHVSFWNEIKKGTPPPEALFLAKREYVRNIPHGQADINSLAIELKILRQYTCLGLGW